MDDMDRLMDINSDTHIDNDNGLYKKIKFEFYVLHNSQSNAKFFNSNVENMKYLGKV